VAGKCLFASMAKSCRSCLSSQVVDLNYFQRRRGFGASGASLRCSTGTTFYEGSFVKPSVVGTRLRCAAAPRWRGLVSCNPPLPFLHPLSLRSPGADAAALGSRPRRSRRRGTAFYPCPVMAGRQNPGHQIHHARHARVEPWVVPSQ